jgi:hypothetical protein
MDFGVSEEQEMMQRLVREIAEDYGLEYWRGKDEAEAFPTEIWDDLTEAGFMGLTVPLEHGGEGLGMEEVVALAGVGLLVHHVVSYRINYVGEREYERVGPVTLMVEPYRRVFVLHLTVVLGAFAVAPVGALAVMVLAKTALDLRGHRREHDRARRRPPRTPQAE